MRRWLARRACPNRLSATQIQTCPPLGGTPLGAFLRRPRTSEDKNTNLAKGLSRMAWACVDTANRLEAAVKAPSHTTGVSPRVKAQELLRRPKVPCLNALGSPNADSPG